MPEGTEVQYLVLADGSNPYLLARVRWPDVAQAISAACPDWLDDVGLFDLPHDPSSVPVTHARAAEIAIGWGALIPSDTAPRGVGQTFIRRMPANWSDMTPAEKRAWSLDGVGSGRRTGRNRRSRGRRLGRSPQPPSLEPLVWTAGPPADAPSPEDIPVPPVIASIPPSVVHGTANAVLVNGTDAVVQPDRRVPAVFSRMGGHARSPEGHEDDGPSRQSPILS